MIDRDKPSGLVRIRRACGYSWLGLKAAWRGEAAFRQETALAVMVIPLGCYFGRNGSERALLVAPILLILIVELLNSSLEAVVDRSGREHHRLAGMAKDMGSAAVLVSLLLLGTVWLLILSDH